MERGRTRLRGKLILSRYFKNLKKDDHVTVVIEPSIKNNLQKRLQGRTGKILGKQGRFYWVSIRDSKKEKKYLIEPIHLKKIGEKK